MIEIQINDDGLYQQLKRYASYSSDITHVCSFNEKFAEQLKTYHLEFDEPEETVYDPLLDIVHRNVMKLTNAPIEMLRFVNIRSEYDPTIAIGDFNRVKILIDNGMLKLSDKFQQVYGPLSYRSKIKELVCAKVRFVGKGKLVDYIDPDLTIQSLKFPDVKETQLEYKQMRLKVMGPLEPTKQRYHEMVTHDQQGNKIFLRFYGNVALLQQVAFSGNVVDIAAKKIMVLKDGSMVIYDPILLPKDLKFHHEVAYTPPNREIPADLYRNALFEFQYRYSIK
jgi:hypothetical protein